jgi:hypothetical protein
MDPNAILIWADKVVGKFLIWVKISLPEGLVIKKRS